MKQTEDNRMIYLVEDDESIRELLVYTLNGQGLVAEGFAYPSDFWHAMEKKIPDLVLLDIMLPEEDGLEILQKLRKKKETKNIPIAMLTAKGSEYDVVKGLDGGADDYIPKPFRMMELVSRVKALLRRGGQEQPQDDEEYVLGELYVSKKRHLVKVKGEEVTLTMKEFELLLLFLSNPGIVFSRAQLLDKIWGYQFDGESRTVDVHIRTLRQKLKEAGRYIETVRGIGYKVGGEE
ncbi:response regulator receiver domain protein [Blautia hansenii DSM 20583]|uniref:Stage 0 sporulation protein A homolog n=2 Tax=Blautia hansenii TaxID=1322 RepID=C9L458_BLAHA|nr:response regulator transcription factor [Blautia hansenii]EEX23165.1 response regulator receiver domain protein [Blautia hansenii DSM 20583]